MEKLVKNLIVLIIIGAAAVGAYVYFADSLSGSSDGNADATAQNQKNSKPKIRVEEKYGFTSEGLDP